jgi:lysophospholipase L1-like esterase
MKKVKIALIFLVFVKVLVAQENPPFWDDIQAFKHRDSVQAPPQHSILFVGSSSFTRWTDIQNYFPGYTIINRGFGGSSIPDVIRYENDVIFKYKPKQIVMYCGENDLAASDTVTAQMVFDRFKKLFNDIRKKFSKIPFVYISLKPSPSRWQLHEKMVAANNQIQSFLAKKKNTVFIDVYHKMLGPDGTPIKGIYIEDNLHMNAKGYAIWKKEIQAILLR